VTSRIRINIKVMLIRNPAFRTDLVIDSEVQTFKHKKLDILKLPIRRTFENIELDPALAASLVPTEVPPTCCLSFECSRQRQSKRRRQALSFLDIGFSAFRYFF
jgi:hypothetical protein